MKYGKMYFCTASYNDGTCDITAEGGRSYTYNRTSFRKLTDIIQDSENDELTKIKRELELATEKIERLERENAILLRITDLEKILNKTTK